MSNVFLHLQPQDHVKASKIVATRTKNHMVAFKDNLKH